MDLILPECPVKRLAVEAFGGANPSIFNGLYAVIPPLVRLILGKLHSCVYKVPGTILWTSLGGDQERDCRMRNHKLLSVGLLAALAFALRSTHADIVVLNDGTETEGEVVREDTQTITLRVHMGAMSGLIEIKRSDVKSVKVSDVHADPAIALGQNMEKEASLVKDVPKAIEAWMKVGEFYDHHAGFSTAAHAAFERVILLDPDNAKAREKLGFIKTANGWTSKDEIRRAEQAKEREAAAAKVAAAARAGVVGTPEDITIELKRDNDLVKRMQEQHVELVQGIAELDRRGAAPVQPIGGEDFVGPPFYSGVLWNGGFGLGGFGYSNPFFGGCGFSNYSSCYSGFSGFSFGFHGKIGSGRFSGRVGF